MEAESIVYTAGTWDLFHIGHLNIIRRARMFGTKLIVGVSTDELVYSYKQHYPIMPYRERYEIIRELKCVDQVVQQSELLPVTQLFLLNADILVLGDDWKDSNLEGINWMKYNKRMIFLPRTEGVSTSELKQKIRGKVC